MNTSGVIWETKVKQKDIFYYEYLNSTTFHIVFPGSFYAFNRYICLASTHLVKCIRPIARRGFRVS